MTADNVHIVSLNPSTDGGQTWSRVPTTIPLVPLVAMAQLWERSNVRERPVTLSYTGSGDDVSVTAVASGYHVLWTQGGQVMLWTANPQNIDYLLFGFWLK